MYSPVFIPICWGVVTLSLFLLSNPRKAWAKWAVSILIVASASWEAYSAYIQVGTRTAIEKHVYQKLYKSTSQYINMLSWAIISSTDEWWPENNAEFFSEKTADLLTTRLNILSQAPTMPSQTWESWFCSYSKQFRSDLEHILKDYSGQLDSETIEIVANVEASYILLKSGGFPQLRQMIGQEWPPHFSGDFQRNFHAKLLIPLKQLVDLLRDKCTEQDIKTDWVYLKNNYSKTLIGSCRIGEPLN